MNQRKERGEAKSGARPEMKAAAQAGTKAAARAEAKAGARAEAKKAATSSEAKAPAQAEAPVTPRLQAYYRETVVPELMQKFGYKTSMQVPRIQKITLNMGVGEATSDRKILDHAMADMTKIAGQKPVATRSRTSIATFKTRKDVAIGCMVTLRGKRMYEFLDRLVTIAMPRIRDFRGISGRAFDGRGNYSMGVKEQIIFPEIEYDKIDALRGMNISITSTAKTDDEARALLAAFRFPFKSN
jgi:large subunit ribosomal protein L5